MRAELYRYELTGPGETAGGCRAWWRRTRVGEYLRPVAKGDADLEAFLREHRLAR